MTINAPAAVKGQWVAVLNTSSGGCDGAAAERMRQVFEQAGLPSAKIVSVGAEGIDAAIADAARMADVVVVLGGDGTIRTAAQACGAVDKLLVPLPGGTMNMLPKALYGDAPWDEALAATLAAPRVRPVSGGRVDRNPFYCAAILGAPALWADAREAARRGDGVEAVKRSVTALRRHAEALDYQLGNGVVGEAEAVAVICPLVSRAMGADEPSLEAAALDPVTAGGMFSLAFHAMFDDWRRDPAVSLARVNTVRVVGHGRLPAILDGERVQLGRVATVDFVPMAFRALTPAPP